jgi:hypothetical protein
MPDVPAPTRAARRAATALLIASITGELLMNTPAQAATPQQQRVLAHLGAAFGLAPGDVEVLILTPRDLPDGAAEFYAETKGSHGHGNHNCIAMGEQVYCSGTEGEFQRLLREQALLQRKDLDAPRLMRLYSLFALPRQVKYVDAGVIARAPQDWGAFPEVVPPTLARAADGGVTLSFYATPVREVQPSKWTVRISPAHEIEVGTAPVARR